MQFRQPREKFFLKKFKSFSAVVSKRLLTYNLFKEKSIKTLCHEQFSFINRDGKILITN